MAARPMSPGASLRLVGGGRSEESGGLVSESTLDDAMEGGRGNGGGGGGAGIGTGGGGAPAPKLSRARSGRLLGSARELMTVDLRFDDDEEATSQAAAAITDKEATPLVHLYRAEVGRLTAYRQRMDNTTNWAVSITSVLVAFSLGNKDTPNYFFAFILVLQLFFCGVEARRHAYYSLVRHRCRLMERGMYAWVLDPTLPAVNWRRPLRESYMSHASMPPIRRSFMQRLKRIYVYMILTTYLGWTFKLATEPPFLWEAYVPVTALVIPFTCWILFIVRDDKLDV